MDAKLHRLISDYQKCVADRFMQLRKELGIDAPKSNAEWVFNGLKNGRLADGSQYFKHGFGCAIKGPSGSVDFDFGEKGEIDGFDAGRLWGFATASKEDYGFASWKDIDVAIKKAASEKDLRYSGRILYYLNERKGN